MQIGVETCAKKRKIAPENDFSILCKLFRLCSEFSYQNDDEHICVDLFHYSVLKLSLTIYFNNIMFSYHSFE